MQRRLIIVIILLLLIIIPLAYYLVSPLFRVVEVHEPSPFNDMLDKMDSKTLSTFNKAVAAMNNNISPMNEQMPRSVRVLRQGSFISRAHDVEGKALLIEKDGEKIIRFEDFMTINGPDLHIRLSSDLGGNDYIDLGKIKATKGNANYELPAGVDITIYNNVLVWCEPFSVLFSYARLS